jgi:ABC-type multidrug transport system ATPase subunit
VPTLVAFLDGDRFFESDGPWLYPLLELESALRETGSPSNDALLTTYDKVVGRAGALLSIRLGVTAIETDLLSRLAIPVLEQHNVRFTAGELADRIFCATEDLLADVDDPDEAHAIILKRIEERRRSQDAVVVVRDLSVVFGGSTILDGLDLDVYPGETVLVRGENGAGKTTLLRTLLGLVEPKNGSVAIAGRAVGGREWRKCRHEAAYVRQLEQPSSLPVSSREIVEIGARAVSPRQIRDRSDDALHRTKASHLARRLFGTLSGGERQRVSIARALAQKPKILLLDEPTVGLDAQGRASLIALLDGLAIRQNVTVLIVSHDVAPDELPRARVLTLREGKLVDEGRS